MRVIRLLGGGSPCFVKGTLILTDKGFEPIENIVVGDKVLTHKGRFKEVTTTMQKQSSTVVLKGNHFGIETTEDHPFYSAEKFMRYMGVGLSKQRELVHVGEWTPAKDMCRKFYATPNEVPVIEQPVPSKRNASAKDMPLQTGDFWYFVGRWLGDGWVRNSLRCGRKNSYSSQIFLCGSKEEEQELIDTVTCIGEVPYIMHESTVTKVAFVNATLCDFLVGHFGKGAKGKYIPSFCFGMPLVFREKLLQGVIDSDGHSPNDTQTTISTVSRTLAHGIR